MDWCNHETIIIYNPNLWNHEKPPINFASTDRPKPLLKSLPQQGCPPLCTWRIQKNDHFICRKGVGLVTWSCLIYKSSMFGMLIQIYPNQSQLTQDYSRFRFWCVSNMHYQMEPQMIFHSQHWSICQSQQRSLFAASHFSRVDMNQGPCPCRSVTPPERSTKTSIVFLIWDG